MRTTPFRSTETALRAELEAMKAAVAEARRQLDEQRAAQEGRTNAGTTPEPKEHPVLFKPLAMGIVLALTMLFYALWQRASLQAERLEEGHIAQK